MESNDSPEIPDRGETSDIPGLPSGVVTVGLVLMVVGLVLAAAIAVATCTFTAVVVIVVAAPAPAESAVYVLLFVKCCFQYLESIAAQTLVKLCLTDSLSVVYVE